MSTNCLSVTITFVKATTLLFSYLFKSLKVFSSYVKLYSIGLISSNICFVLCSIVSLSLINSPGKIQYPKYGSFSLFLSSIFNFPSSAAHMMSIFSISLLEFSMYTSFLIKYEYYINISLACQFLTLFYHI